MMACINLQLVSINVKALSCDGMQSPELAHIKCTFVL